MSSTSVSQRFIVLAWLFAHISTVLGCDNSFLNLFLVSITVTKFTLDVKELLGTEACHAVLTSQPRATGVSAIAAWDDVLRFV